MDMINRKDYDMSSHFEEEKQPPKSPHEHAKKRSDRLETEAYYLEVIQEKITTHLNTCTFCIFGC